VDAVAIRVVHDRLVARPAALEAAWPCLGPECRRVAGKFLALVRACDEREAAQAGGGPRTEREPGPGGTAMRGAQQEAPTSVHGVRSPAGERRSG
jgi:hypothetical protein